MMKASEIYEAMVAVLPPEHIDHHETDLYVKMTPESSKIIRESGLIRGYGYTVFGDQITGTLWYDIAFAYTPEWERRLGPLLGYVSKKKQRRDAARRDLDDNNCIRFAKYSQNDCQNC